MITKEQITALAKRFDIDEFTILREYLQLVFLSSLYSLGEGEKIYFKGGTAIHLLFNSFRFSEDLDFTSLLNERELKKLLKKIVVQVRLEIPDLKLNSLKIKKTSLTARLVYHVPEFKIPLTVYLEFSLREKPKTREVSILKTLFPISPYPVIVHLSPKEILAEKVRALMIREKGRDLFDIWYLATKEIKFDWKLINQKMKYYQREITKERILKKIKTLSPEKIKADLAKFLPRKQRVLVGNLKDLTIQEISRSL